VNALRPLAYRGEVVSGAHPAAKTHPHMFELAPSQEDPPAPGEQYAVATVAFRTRDGRIVTRGQTFRPFHPLVREHPRYFRQVLPFR
jgi:hypothetical protein